MTLPIYQGDHPTTRPSDANRGLWYTRFYKGFGPNWEVDETSKRSWIKENAGPCGNDGELEAHAKRMKQLSAALGGNCADFDTVWHFATGLGISHPVENGFAWHHTLGVPFLAASGVKGLLRSWTECWRDFDNEETRQATITRCFGASAGDDDSSAGNLIFFDALPIERVHLAADVMTPHMGKWYEQGHEIHGSQDYATKAPADWYSPVPVPFLVVKKAALRFMIAPRLIGDETADTQARVDAQDAMQQLEQALEWLGAGAKTAAGYGRMTRRQAADEKLRLELAAAGIQIASGTIWQGAKVTWNKGSQVLDVVSPDGRCQVRGDKAKPLIESLSDAGRKRLMDGKKPLIVEATVNIEGNNITLQALREPPA